MLDPPLPWAVEGSPGIRLPPPEAGSHEIWCNADKGRYTTLPIHPGRA